MFLIKYNLLIYSILKNKRPSTQISYFHFFTKEVAVVFPEFSNKTW